MAITTYRGKWAFGNVHQPGTTPNRQAAIRTIFNLAPGGIVTFNEAAKDHAYLVAQAHARGMSVWCFGENAIAWPDDLDVVARFAWKITPGGYIGADGVATPRAGDDDRRVGPPRYVLFVVFWSPTQRQAFGWGVKHELAKASTSAKWRQSLLKAGWRRQGAYIAQTLDDVPNGALTGDTNWPYGINLPGIPDVLVPTPATYGARRYDKLAKWGTRIAFGVVREKNTTSDHDAIYGNFTVTGESVNRPVVDFNNAGVPIKVVIKPSPRTPGAKPKTPWQRYSQRWRRRHPIRWRRIVRRWRRNH